MAETTGVTNTGSGHESRSSANSNPLKGKNKKLIYLGGAGVAILLLGHKGSNASGASGGDPNAQLQAASDQAAQAETDAALAAAIPPGGIAPTTVDTGGGTYNAPGSSITTSPPSVTVETGATGGPSGTPDNDNDLTKSDVQGHFDELFPATAGKIDNIDKKVNQAPKHGKPKPASKSGKTNHPSAGTKVQGHTGTQVHGRTFPGATGHTIGPARNVGGNVHQDVTVHHGGHTATHTSVNQGQQWIDNVKGKNPPSRGPQQTVHPTSKPEPARKPAQKRKK